ncbi:hypothetical protein DIPPA_63840 [Diplonema papillatum]|nr:hypothetical protein DIPPA_63839 [Diplonema papillatum]KAJ9465921.1 hypothetical protein DIPPA_63840 [Diplonema papillatum]
MLSEHDMVVAEEELSQAVAKCWNNDFDGSLSVLKPRSKSDPRYAMELACVTLVRDMMSADTGSKMRLGKMFGSAGELASSQKDKYTESSSIFTFLQFSESHRHKNWSSADLWKLLCEVIEADAVLNLAMSQVFTQNYIYAGLNFRRAWSCYHSLHKILKSHQSSLPLSICDRIKYGVGAFYVALSLVPSTILVVLSALGFVANAEVGVEYLRDVFHGGGVRSAVAALVLLFYYLFIPSGLEESTQKLVAAESVLDLACQRYPNNSYFFGFRNFHCRKIGDTLKALTCIDTAINNAHRAAESNEFVSQGTRGTLLLSYMRADTLFMDQQWEEAAQAYKKISEEVQQERHDFEFTGTMALAQCAAHVMLHNYTRATEYLNSVEEVSNRNSKQDIQTLFLVRILGQDRTKMYLAAYLVLYTSRDMAHLGEQAREKLLVSLSAMDERHSLSSRKDTRAMTLLFKGCLLSSRSINQALSSWLEALSLFKVHGPHNKKFGSNETDNLPVVSPLLPLLHYEIGELQYRTGHNSAAEAHLTICKKLKAEKTDTFINRCNRALHYLHKSK